MVDHNIPIYCLTIERAIERQQRIRTAWRQFNYKFFYGVDRRNTQPIQGRTQGETACILSYIKLLNYLIDNRYEEVITIEDDTYPNIDPIVFWQHIKELSDNHEVMIGLLYNNRPWQYKKDEGKFCIPKRRCRGLCGVYFKRAGLFKLKGLLDGSEGAADHHWNEFKNGSLLVSRMSIIKHDNIDTLIGPRKQFKKTLIRKFIE